MLYFVDESGIDLKQAPYLVLAGVSIAEAKVWPMARAFNELRDEILRFSPDAPYEVKGSKLLKTRVFNHARLREKMALDERTAAIERLLEKNASGESVGRDELAALAQAKLEFVDRVLDLAADFEMKIFASMVPRDAPGEGIKKGSAPRDKPFDGKLAVTPDERQDLGLVRDKRISSLALVFVLLQQLEPDLAAGRVGGDCVP